MTGPHQFGINMSVFGLVLVTYRGMCSHLLESLGPDTSGSTQSCTESNPLRTNTQ